MMGLFLAAVCLLVGVGPCGVCANTLSERVDTLPERVEEGVDGGACNSEEESAVLTECEKACREPLVGLFDFSFITG